MESILVVDDEQSMLEFMEIALSKEGYPVSCAQEGEQALKMLSGKPGFDLVISDLRMGEVDGLELLKASKDIDPDIPFIFMTAYASSEAAISGKIDYLLGLKENVIMGRLIPAGTGMEYYRNIDVPSPFQDIADDPLELEEATAVLK
jgi:CheY-like chemotaxis protein